MDIARAQVASLYHYDIIIIIDNGHYSAQIPPFESYDTDNREL